MSYEVVLSPAFRRDILKIRFYLDSHDFYEETRQKILNGVDKDLRRLENNPRLGQSLETLVMYDTDYRRLTSGDYLIFYKVFDEEKIVRVYHIYHSRENYIARLGLN